MGNINDFYYRILNIGNSDIDIIDVINRVISDFSVEYGINLDLVGLCKVASRVMNDKFKEFGVESIVVNTKNLYGFYEHEVVLVRSVVDNKLSYYLIDLTFKQFFNNGEVLRAFFNEYPTDKLMKYGKEELMFHNDLLKYGYSKVDSGLISSYFSCFSNSDDKIEIVDIDRFFTGVRINRL